MDDLELPKTKLSYQDGVLRKLGKGESVIASLSAEDITAVELRDTREFGPALLLGGTFLALGVVAKLYIPVAGWGWAVGILCLAVTAFAALMAHGKEIHIETKNGSVGYPISDAVEEAEGFVLSLTHIFQRIHDEQQQPCERTS